MTSTTALLTLRGASVLWLIWGVFHIFIGVALIVFLQGNHPTGDLSAVPEVLQVEMLGSEMTYLMAAAIALSADAYLSTDKLADLQPTDPASTT